MDTESSDPTDYPPLFWPQGNSEHDLQTFSKERMKYMIYISKRDFYIGLLSYLYFSFMWFVYLLLNYYFVNCLNSFVWNKMEYNIKAKHPQM